MPSHRHCHCRGESSNVRRVGCACVQPAGGGGGDGGGGSCCRRSARRKGACGGSRSRRGAGLHRQRWACGWSWSRRYFRRRHIRWFHRRRLICGVPNPPPKPPKRPATEASASLRSPPAAPSSPQSSRPPAGRLSRSAAAGPQALPAHLCRGFPSIPNTTTVVLAPAPALGTAAAAGTAAHLAPARAPARAPAPAPVRAADAVGACGTHDPNDTSAEPNGVSGMRWCAAFGEAFGWVVCEP